MNEENNLADIFNDEIVELNTVVQQFLLTLPKIEKIAQDPELKDTVNQQLMHSRNQARQLGRIMDILGIAEKRMGSSVVDLQIDGSWLDELDDDYATDAQIICMAIKVEHYKMASCLSLCAFANVLGLGEIASTLKGAFPQISLLFKSTASWSHSARHQTTNTQTMLDEGILAPAGAGIDSN